MNSRLKCRGLSWVVASGLTLREPEHKDVSTGSPSLSAREKGHTVIFDGYISWSLKGNIIKSVI